MQFGLGTLKLSSQQFWQMSLPELEAALKAHFPSHHNTVSRSWLEETMKIHPDEN